MMMMIDDEMRCLWWESFVEEASF